MKELQRLALLLLVACGPGALVYQHPTTGKRISCDGGGAFAAWERQQRRDLCVASALSAGYELLPDDETPRAPLAQPDCTMEGGQRKCR